MVLQLKKQLGGASAPPIVALTARTGETEMRIAQKFGCAAFVSKPFVPEELLALIKSLVPTLDSSPSSSSSDHPSEQS
jgi:DNA-binding response OmpR family regulator